MEVNGVTHSININADDKVVGSAHQMDLSSRNQAPSAKKVLKVLKEPRRNKIARQLPPPELWQPSRLGAGNETVRKRIAAAVVREKKRDQTMKIEEAVDESQPIDTVWVKQELDVDIHDAAGDDPLFPFVNVKEDPDLYSDMQNEAQEYVTFTITSVKEEPEYDDCPNKFKNEDPQRRLARLQCDRICSSLRLLNEEFETEAEKKERLRERRRARYLGETDEERSARIARQKLTAANWLSRNPTYYKEYTRNRFKRRETETEEERQMRVERHRALCRQNYRTRKEAALGENWYNKRTSVRKYKRRKENLSSGKGIFSRIEIV